MIGEDRPRILSRITHNRQQHTRTGHIGEGRIGGGEQGEGSPGEGSPTGILARTAQDRGPHTPPGHMRAARIGAGERGARAGGYHRGRLHPPSYSPLPRVAERIRDNSSGPGPGRRRTLSTRVTRVQGRINRRRRGRRFLHTHRAPLLDLRQNCTGRAFPSRNEKISTEGASYNTVAICGIGGPFPASLNNMSQIGHGSRGSRSSGHVI